MAEANQVNWRGIRPVHPVENIQVHPGTFETSVAGKTRTQILKYKSVNATEAIIHTVTTGKTLFITSASLVCQHTANDEAFIRIRDGSDVEVTRILYAFAYAGATGHLSNSFPMPISVAADYDITVNMVSGGAYATIQGWEE